MKKFFFLILFFAFNVYAGFDEVILSTQDKTCSIHYLTSYPKDNWLIRVSPNACQDGWVHGYAEVEIYSPSSEMTEILSGYFMDGYWLASFINQNHVVDRTNPEEKTQAITLLLKEDKEANISYYVQLRATQLEDHPYSSFQACPDFRMLVVTLDSSVFQNPAFQERIIQEGLEQGHSFCTNFETLALFGATEVSSPNIQFQMQVDVETGERMLLQKNAKEIEQSEQNIPVILRTENSDVLLSVESKQGKAVVSYDPSQKSLSQKEKNISFQKKSFLAHLKILSEISGAPVQGRCVVHISRVNLDGTAMVDLPDELLLQDYPNLKSGWVVVEGTLWENKMRVQHVDFCQKEWCLDVS